MPRFVQGPSFNKCKRDLSVSSRNVKNSLALLLFLGFILTVISLLSISFILIPSSITLMDLNLLSLYSLNIISDFYSQNAALFIIFSISAIICLGFFVFYLVQISLHARNYFRIFTLEKQEKRFQYSGIFFILYVAFTLLGFIPVNYLNTSMFFIGSILLLLALFMNYRTFQDYRKQKRFIKKPSILPLVGGIINVLSWLIMYFTILSIYGNLIGLFLIYLGFRKLVVDFKLINSKSTILMDPSTPAPSTPIPKAPSIYDRTMIQDEASETQPVEDTSATFPAVPEPTPVEDSPVTPSDVPEPTLVEDSPVTPSDVPEPTLVEDSPVTPSVIPESSPSDEPSIEAPSLTAPKPLDINQKFCPNCKNVVYKTDKVCEHCDVDISQPSTKF
ncbi:MAG: hypothetical protein ACTSQC_12325 [Candidatus Heimdallarchaeaceae archaeon]